MQPSRIRASALAVLLSPGLGHGSLCRELRAAARQEVNINTASVTELAYLPRIGAKVAARVVEHRKEKPFARPEDLMEVKGIGEKLFVSLKPYVSVSGPTTLERQGASSSSSSRRPSPDPAGRSLPAPSRWARDGDRHARPGPLRGPGPLSCSPASRCPSSCSWWSDLVVDRPGRARACPACCASRWRSARRCTRRPWRSTGLAPTRSPETATSG